MKYKTEIQKILDDYMFEILAELNVPHTDEMLTGYMQDPERVDEAYQEMLERIEKYFVDEYGVEPMQETEKPMQNSKEKIMKEVTETMELAFSNAINAHAPKQLNGSKERSACLAVGALIIAKTTKALEEALDRTREETLKEVEKLIRTGAYTIKTLIRGINKFNELKAKE